MTNTTTPSWLTTDEAGMVLRVGKSAVYAMIRRGELPARRFGKVLRIPASAVQVHAVVE